MVDELPLGLRFSLLYLRHGEMVADSQRLRARLVSLFKKFSPSQSGGLSLFLDAELGTRLTAKGWETTYLDWDRLERGELRDLLDSITLIGRFLKMGNRRPFDEFAQEISRILVEESANYRIDEEFGLHPAIDAAYQANYESVVARLNGSKFEAARQHLHRADKELLPAGNNREAIRAVFDAVENLFKIIFPREQSLNVASIQSHLAPLVEKVFPEVVEKRASSHMIKALHDWVNCCHIYRHEQGHADPTPPNDDLSVLVVSQGISFVRWFASISQRKGSVAN